MRATEILGGYKIALSNEETKLVRALKKKGTLTFDKLSDRNKQVVYDLYKKNVVNITDDGLITKNDVEKLENILW